MRDYLMSYQFTDNGSHTQHTADAFAQFDWNPHRRFNLIAGLRFDHFSAANLSHLSPKLGVMYKVANCSLRASYAGGFRAPTLKEMYMDFYMGNIFMIYGNPELKAETSHNFSLSAEYMAGQHSFTVTGFYNLVDNRITTVWNQELDGQVYTNMSPLQVAGAEANASGRYACGISWRVSYAYTREMIERGQPLLSFDPSPCGHSTSGVRQDVEKLRFEHRSVGTLAFGRHVRRLHRVDLLRGDRAADLSGLYDLEIEPCAASVAGHGSHAGRGQPLQLPSRLLLQQFAHDHRHDLLGWHFAESRKIFQ